MTAPICAPKPERRIDLAAIDREGFHVKPDERGRILVAPLKSKHTWRADEIHLRSLLCAADGSILSVGFSKFFNHGEDPRHDAETARLLASGAEVRYTEKLDGTLIIRSVIDGEVHLRTRGNHSLGDFQPAVMALIRERYPKVLDVRVCAADSTLFEYTAPDNRIVVPYAEPALTLLGFAVHESGSVYPARDGDADLFNTPVLQTRIFAGDPKTIAALIEQDVGSEGIVAWIEREILDWHLVKFKSLWWLRAAAFRASASYDRVREYVWSNQIATEDGFLVALDREGVDFEIARLHIETFREVMRDQAARRAELDAAERAHAHVPALPDRKLKYLALQSAGCDIAGTLIHWAVGDAAKYLEAPAAYVLGLSRAQFTNLKSKPQPRIILDLEAARRSE